MSSERFLLRSAVYLFLRKDEKFLLARRYNTGYMDGKYSLISGHLEGNETVFDAIIREAYEEARIKIAKEDLESVTVLHRKSSDLEYIDFFFITTKWEGEPIIGEPDKCDDLSWFSLDLLPDNLLGYVKEALTNYSNKIPFSESGWD